MTHEHTRIFEQNGLDTKWPQFQEVCRVLDYELVNWCFKCNEFRHISNVCRNKEVCYFCDEKKHNHTNCPSKNIESSTINALTAKKKKSWKTFELKTSWTESVHCSKYVKLMKLI